MKYFFQAEVKGVLTLHIRANSYEEAMSKFQEEMQTYNGDGLRLNVSYLVSSGTPIEEEKDEVQTGC